MNDYDALVEVRLNGGLESWKDGLSLVAPAAAGPDCEAEPANPQVAFQAMGCTIRVEIASAEPEAHVRLAQVEEWFEDWESRLTRFRPDSELSRINASAGIPLQVSAVMWEVIQASIRAARLSGGLVTPLILPALEAAGYDRPFDDLRGEDRAGSPKHGRVENWQEIVLNPADRTIRVPEGARLDLGGVGKGWAAERAADRLKDLGPVMVSAGGDIAFGGGRRGSLPWKIAVADPHRPERDLTALALGSGGVATSGTDYRRWTSGGAPMHHLIDPRTGMPSRTDVISATVVAPSLQMAEIAAKVVILLGGQEGLAWVERRPSLAALIVLESGERLESERLGRHV